METSQPIYAPISISRESSQSSLQPQSQKLGRFSVEKTSSSSETTTTTTHTSSDDARKIGRFELTGRSSTSTTSSSDGGSSAPELHRDRLLSSGGGDHAHALYPQLEFLLKQTDAQRSLLQDMMVQMNASSSGSGIRSRAVSVSDQQR